jgi:hypothetical protein
MSSMRTVLLTGLALFGFAAVAAGAHMIGPIFVAEAQNLRGAVYVGQGPTPHHASEAALCGCKQNSIIPRTCRVISVRMESPPIRPPMPPAAFHPYERLSKSHGHPQGQAGPYPAAPYQAAPYRYHSSAKKYDAPAKAYAPNPPIRDARVREPEKPVQRRETPPPEPERKVSKSESASSQVGRSVGKPHGDKYQWGRPGE